MTKKRFWGASLAVAALAVTVIQFIPAPPLVVPATLPQEQRADHRLLNFEGIANFRDLGGYRAVDGRQVRWGKLYRSGNFSEASNADLIALDTLGLATFIDFRSGAEKAEEPNRLPEAPDFTVVEIPVLDIGNENLFSDIKQRIEADDFSDFDPGATMQQANRQFADEFTPQFRQFIHTVLDANGAPVIWHCTAGKDRTGFAAAILLRVLGVPQDIVIQDYMASREPALASRKNQLLMLKLFKGEQVAQNVAVLMGVEQDWLEAGFAQIDVTWGNFDNYVANGLQLGPADIERLKANLLQ
ncbi:MAG: tyrosine-protein phosphatase [Halioglobus sp.]|nr:tyrosine-protein phosphatase [Halioglobus sp.]MCB1707645.1 tyrosine-protein phosphatase [Halioglobus sp.]MCP5122095.1 tyrosine-protein phosphatase [Pseudomonadales bacterium]MCP5192359.1 tyrosine-protein phosphatase [Pseudomonadales bacterium]